MKNTTYTVYVHLNKANGEVVLHVKLAKLDNVNTLILKTVMA
jgi:hypothetical protein